MPTPPDKDDQSPSGPKNGQASASQKPKDGTISGKRAAREARLADALRANLRRRKQAPTSEQEDE